MRTLTRTSRAWLVVAALGCLAIAAQAQSVTVTNNSFENNSATSTGAACCGPGTQIPGWSFSSNDYDGTQDQSPNNPVGTDGSVWAFVNNSASFTYKGTSLGTIAPSTPYTMKVLLGNNYQDASNTTDGPSIAYGRPGTFLISLTANGNVIATTTVPAFQADGVTPTIPNDKFEDFSVTYTSGASAAADSNVGATLGIVLGAQGLGGGSQNLFDNVRLSTPEPGALSLIAAGGLTLLGRRRR